MGSLFAILGVAGDGLAAQTAGLNVTGQNVANANTPGYSRLSVNLETLQLGDSYGGSVRAANVLRSSDQFAYARVLEEQSKGGAADARSTALAQVEAIVAPSGGTIADRANAFFSSMSTLSSSPSDPSARAAVLGSAASLAQSISSTAAGLASAKGSLLTTAQGVATQVNSELAQIAQLNGQIAQARAAGDPAASLSDQRDRLVSSVGTEIGAKTVEEPSGITLFAGGTALVVGNTAASIHVGLDAASNLKIVANRGGGDPALDITSNTNDGTLGGIREARDQDIPAVASQLDQFASDLATSVNSIHSAGFGLDGVGGRNLFAQPATVSGAAYAFSIDPTLVGHPERIAAAKSAADVPGGNDVALQLAQLASQSLGGGGTPSARFGSIAASLGAAKSAADAESQLRKDTVTQAKNLHDSSTGVALDEEMANLSKFQRAYEASAKVLQTVDGLLSGLLQGL